MKEYAVKGIESGDAMDRIQRMRARFIPLAKLGYKISGSDNRGFAAVDKSTGKTIRRLTYEAFAKAVRKAGLTRAARGRLISTRKTPDGKLRDQVERQRLTLLAIERREMCPSKRRPAPRPSRAPVATARRPRMDLCRNWTM